MEPFDLDAWVSRSRALDLSDLPWDEVRAHPLSPGTLRVLRYMQDVESHAIVYLRALLSTRAIDDPQVATFLACWLYEETAHGRALARFLAASGHPVAPRPRSRASLRERLEGIGAALLSRSWPGFVAVHMTWGAINELTTLTGYRQLARRAAHPVLSELLSRIIRDESRHFLFYYEQAKHRLADPRTRRIARGLVSRFWAPVGSGVRPDAEVRFVAAHLLSGPDGRAAARRVDETIRRLPGFEQVPLLEAWLERAIGGAGGGHAASPGQPGESRSRSRRAARLRRSSHEAKATSAPERREARGRVARPRIASADVAAGGSPRPTSPAAYPAKGSWPERFSSAVRPPSITIA
jgi:hypothetical protein